jgi:hypothetical protein
MTNVKARTAEFIGDVIPRELRRSSWCAQEQLYHFALFCPLKEAIEAA